MPYLRSLILFIFLIVLAPLSGVAFGHSLFNSAEQFVGGYRVQVATLPEFPEIGKTSQILLKVTDKDFNDVERFTVGIRFFYHDQQIDAIQPQSVIGSHLDLDYVWKNQGNHIVKIDLYDMEGESGILTYTFNMSTQSPFGQIFIVAITIGASMFAIVVGYIYLPKILRSKTRS